MHSWHPGILCADQVLNWIHGDSESAYQSNLQDSDYAKYAQSQNWDQLTYCINSRGFRCDEFEDAPDPQTILTLGCSFTMGVGLAVEKTWPQLIGSTLGKKVINLAWPGMSADTCFRLAQHWVPRIKPSLVVMLTPPNVRLELAVNDPELLFEVFMPASRSKYFTTTDTFLKQWWTNEANSQLNNAKNKFAITGLCNSLNIPSRIYDADHVMAQQRADYARDRLHAGESAHRELANNILGTL